MSVITQPSLFTDPVASAALDPHRLRRSAKRTAHAERYELRRWWTAAPKRWVAWLMFNPSVADAEKDDPTILRIIGFTRRWGYDGLIVVNLYPFVTPDPGKALGRASRAFNGPNWYDRDSLMHNERFVEEAGRAAALRMAAFGNLGSRDDCWTAQVLEAYGQPQNDPGAQNGFFCLGFTKHGMPVHPLARGRNRVADSQRPILWRAS